MKPSASKPTTNQIKKAATLATVASMSMAESLSQLVYNAISIDITKETKLPNGIIIYDNDNNTQLLTNLVNKFPTLQKDKGFAKVPKNNQIKLILRDNQ